MGNPIVFGTPLRALPAPTGLALLALAAAGKPVPAIGPAIRFLQHALSQTLAPVSLGWGLLGLRAWGAEPRGSASGWPGPMIAHKFVPPIRSPWRCFSSRQGPNRSAHWGLLKAKA